MATDWQLSDHQVSRTTTLMMTYSPKVRYRTGTRMRCYCSGCNSGRLRALSRLNLGCHRATRLKPTIGYPRQPPNSMSGTLKALVLKNRDVTMTVLETILRDSSVIISGILTELSTLTRTVAICPKASGDSDLFPRLIRWFPWVLSIDWRVFVTSADSLVFQKLSDRRQHLVK